MKNKILIMGILFLAINSTIVCAGFADFSDEDAEKENNQILTEQTKQNKGVEEKSNNNYLIDLKIEGYDLTPEFDKQILEYNVKNEIKEDEIKVIAELDDSKAKVEGIGKVKIQDGENQIRIDVTSERGTVRTYKIKLTHNVNQKENETEVIETYAQAENKIIEQNTTKEVQNINYSANNEENMKKTIKFERKHIIIVFLIIIVIIIIFVVINKRKNKGKRFR